MVVLYMYMSPWHIILHQTDPSTHPSIEEKKVHSGVREQRVREKKQLNRYDDDLSLSAEQLFTHIPVLVGGERNKGKREGVKVSERAIPTKAVKKRGDTRRNRTINNNNGEKKKLKSLF